MAGISTGRAPRPIRSFGCGPRQASGGSQARGPLCRGAAGQLRERVLARRSRRSGHICPGRHASPTGGGGRSAGGSDEPWNRTTLCAFHHLRGVHAGPVRCTGRAPEGLVFELSGRNSAPPLLRARSGNLLLGRGSVGAARQTRRKNKRVVPASHTLPVCRNPNSRLRRGHVGRRCPSSVGGFSTLPGRTTSRRLTTRKRHTSGAEILASPPSRL